MGISSSKRPIRKKQYFPIYSRVREDSMFTVKLFRKLCKPAPTIQLGKLGQGGACLQLVEYQQKADIERKRFESVVNNSSNNI